MLKCKVYHTGVYEKEKKVWRVDLANFKFYMSKISKYVEKNKVKDNENDLHIQ